ncbi:MAG: hypothetical protein ABI142_09785, partial [Bryocella sp.]
MTWPKRIGLSLASALIADIFVVGAVAFMNPPGLRFEGFFGMEVFALYLIIPGWVLSLPAILLLYPANGWRFWTLAAFGCLIGPLVMVAMQLWSLHINPNELPRGPGMFEYLA